jgi:Glycosyl transferases group 1
MRILLWHVHGSWTTAFVQGRHDYLVPVVPGRGPDGMGRARTYPWPSSVVEVPADELSEVEVDVVLLQRPQEIELVRSWLGREPGRDIPAVYVEHNTPRADVPNTRHPVADHGGITLVHVTHFNELMWDNGVAPTQVIEHGVVDPGPLYTGELARVGMALNEPVRRWRVTGTDLLPRFAEVAPLDVYGMKVTHLPEHLGRTAHEVAVVEDPPQDRMHAELARRRVYAHPCRWTSLGLSLVEAMHLGMPVVALATTEAVEAVPPEAGCVSTRVDVLVDAVEEFLRDPDLAREVGQRARAAALARYGLDRFLAGWDSLLAELAPAAALLTG